MKLIRRFARTSLVTLAAFSTLGGLFGVNQASAQMAPPDVAASPVRDGLTRLVKAVGAPTLQQQIWLQSSLDQRIKLAAELGEEGARIFAKSRDYTPLFDGVDRFISQGPDQVYIGADNTVHVIEAKGGGSPLKRSYGYDQGTPENTVKSAERVVKSGKAGGAEKAASEVILKAAQEGRLKVHVVRTPHILGEPYAAVLDRTLASTDEAARLATAALDDLARTASTAARIAASESVATTSEVASVATKPATKVIGAVARKAPVIGAVVDAGMRLKESAEIENRFDRGELDQQDREVEHAKNIVGIAGGWGGAFAGAKLGALGGGAVGTACGGVGAPIGAVAGGVVGGVTGYIGGEAAAEAGAEWTVRQVHAAGSTISDGAGQVWGATTRTTGAAGDAVKGCWSWITNW